MDLPDYNDEMNFMLNYLTNYRTECKCKNPVLIDYDPIYLIYDCGQCLGFVPETRLHELNNGIT